MLNGFFFGMYHQSIEPRTVTKWWSFIGFVNMQFTFDGFSWASLKSEVELENMASHWARPTLMTPCSSAPALNNGLQRKSNYFYISCLRIQVMKGASVNSVSSSPFLNSLYLKSINILFEIFFLFWYKVSKKLELQLQLWILGALYLSCF